ERRRDAPVAGDRPGRRREQSAQHAEQRRLANAVGADDDRDLAATQRNIDAVEQPTPAARDGDTLGGQDRRPGIHWLRLRWIEVSGAASNRNSPMRTVASATPSAWVGFWRFVAWTPVVTSEPPWPPAPVNACHAPSASVGGCGA